MNPDALAAIEARVEAVEARVEATERPLGLPGEVPFLACACGYTVPDLTGAKPSRQPQVCPSCRCVGLAYAGKTWWPPRKARVRNVA